MKKLTPPQNILNELLAGNTRFISGSTILSSESSLKKLKEFAQIGQVPKAIVLCCSDSRAPVEIIFDQDIGDLFVIRVAGNIIAPSLIGSVEFAASTFGTNLVLVMGHTHCGAIKATLDHITNSNPIASENLHDIVSRIKPHIYSITTTKETSPGEHIAKAVEANVRASVNQLTFSSRLIEDLILNKKLEIHGAVLDLHSGVVKLLEI
jgi:carbonic anhydrase